MNSRSIGLNTNLSNCSTNNSSESTSLYETPINSPTNESLLNSITIDSLQTDRTSNITENVDINNILSLSSCHSFESLSNRSIRSTPISIETNSTLKAKQFNRNTSLLQNNSNASKNETLYEQMNQSINKSSIPESSIWFRRQTGSSTHDYIDSNVNNNIDKCRLLLKYMEELDSEHLQIIGIEQQINSISLQCKTIRENIVSKTNNIFSLINDILISKESAQNSTQTQAVTQTETQTINEELVVSERDQKSISGLSKTNPFHTSRKDLMDFTSNIDSVIAYNSSKPKQTEYSIFAELSSTTKSRLYRLPALVKGYLIRRLMKTEKVIYIKNTIRDTTQLLLNFKNSPPNREITAEDINFHKRLIIQLENACHEFYDILINYPKSAQMALISRSRERILERQYRTGSVLSTSSNFTSNLNSSLNNSLTSGLSSVTRKLLEKKLTNQNSSLLNKCQTQTHSQSNSQSRPNTSKTVVPNAPTKKNSFSQSIIKTSSEISDDSSNRINHSLRRSQRNPIKTKTITKRRSPNKKK